MIVSLLIGCIMITANLAIQILVVISMIRFFTRTAPAFGTQVSFFQDARVLFLSLLGLFAGNLFQVGTWALLFLQLGEFDIYKTAFYHSLVNFTSLGYGDIVMSEKWRMLGGLEAANGVLMFALTGGTVLSVMTRVFNRHQPNNTEHGQDNK
jgi:hypothetical protein